MIRLSRKSSETRTPLFVVLVTTSKAAAPSVYWAAAVGAYSDFSKTRALLQAHRSDRLTNPGVRGRRLVISPPDCC